ncbi:MAG TPA: hypothetical protein VF042_14255 [Gemmatimonadaceae bacterium]
MKSRIRFVVSPGRLLLICASLIACVNGDAQSRSSDGIAENGGAQPGRENNAPLRPTAPLPEGALMLQRATIDDPGVIAAMPAMSVLVPVGWRGRGGVTGQSGQCAQAFVVDWQAISPDGKSGIAIFPTEVWSKANTTGSGGCIPAAFSSAREYLESWVQRRFQDARIIDYRDRPDYATAATEYAQRTQQQFYAAGLSNARVQADGGEILFAYTQDGVDMRGMAGVSAVFFSSAMANPMGGTALTSSSGSTLGTFAAFAPNGQLNFELVEAARRSILPNGNWLDRLFEIQQQRGGIAVEGTRQRAALIVAGGAEATRNNIAAFHRMSGFDRAGSGGGSGGSRGGSEVYPGESTDDQIQRRSLEAIRGVDTYMDPVDNSPVQLDHTYGNAWRVNNQDAYILTKDPTFNPGQYGIEATQMKVIR